MRRKMILALMLVIVSSVWMTSKAMCQVSTCTCLFDDPPVAISGILQLVPLPCPESTEDIPCPPCLTIALNANEQLYYLNGLNDNLNALLDTLVYPVNATVTGHVYTAQEGGLAIRVQDISLHASLPSLCDEWNVLAFRSHMGYAPDEYYTQHYRLTSDTVMNGQLYTKLYQENSYSGAMREGNNRDIYYVPADSTHEYLLYAFNAQVGDTLPNNVWFGISNGDFLSIKTATIKEIKPTYPRTFVIDLEYWSHGILESSHTEREWIEGVGMPTAPDGEFFMPLAGGFSNILLCAYKNGEQVYVSEMGEQYGCEYNDDSHSTPSDTIPLFSYTGDDPGSSTVDPVDPNQVVVTLNGNELTIREFSNVDVTYTLRHYEPAKMPVRAHTSASDTFRNEITLQITESGEYQLLLTNPSWDYSIYGTFFYSPQGIESVHSTSLPQKVLQNGHFYILRGEKVYTITGQRVR